MLRFNNKIFIMLVMLASCANRDGQGTQSGNDTTKAIELAVKTVLEEDFPEMEPVKKRSNLKDSIFLTTTLLSLSHLPQRVDSFRFKVLPDTLICSVIRLDTLSGDLPNYLKLTSFEKRDTGYFVELESLSCQRGGESGSVGVFIVKSKDTFVFQKK